MFHIIELENDAFVAYHEELGLYTVIEKKHATVFNEETIKERLRINANKEGIFVEGKRIPIKTIHCLDNVKQMSFEDFIEKAK